jgi:hypothetical protein
MSKRTKEQIETLRELCIVPHMRWIKDISGIRKEEHFSSVGEYNYHIGVEEPYVQATCTRYNLEPEDGELIFWETDVTLKEAKEACRLHAQGQVWRLLGIEKTQ